MRAFGIYAVFLSLAPFSRADIKALSKSKYIYNQPSPVHSVIDKNAKTKKCPDNFWLQNRECIKKDEVNFSNTCPPGTVDLGFECVKFLSPRLTCKPPQVLQGLECVATETVEPVVRCEPGTDRDGDRCILKIEEPPICPEGSYAADDRCVQMLPIESRCPPGYTRKGLVCSKIDESPVELRCPITFTMKGRMCEWKTFLEPECPRGTQEEGRQCARFLPKQNHCPPGFNPSGLECVKVVTAAKEVFCLNGGNPNEHCKARIPVELTPFCPPPSKHIGEQCELIKMQPAAHRCPDDYHLKGLVCVKTIEFDCSITKHEVECEEPVKPSKKEHHGRNLGEKKQLTKAKYVHEGDSPFLPVCHKVPTVIHKTCTREITAEATPYCLEGVYKGGNNCEIKDLSRPMFKCNAREDALGCFQDEFSEPIRVCPKTFARGPPGECSKVEVTSVISQCPHDTQGPNCAIFEEKRCPKEGCEKIVVEPPTILCPEGFTRKSTHKKVICIRESLVESIQFCPHGTEQHGLACLRFESPIKIERTKVLPLITTCPAGYSDEGHECDRKEFSPAIQICPEGTKFDGDKCIDVIPSHRGCPKGSVLEKGKCWVFVKTAPIEVDTVVERTTIPPVHKKIGHW